MSLAAMSVARPLPKSRGVNPLCARRRQSRKFSAPLTVCQSVGISTGASKRTCHFAEQKSSCPTGLSVSAPSLLRPAGRARTAVIPRTASDANLAVPPGARDQDLVLVAGGTGRVGRRVVERLAASGVRVRVLARDPQSHEALRLRELPGVEVVPGDVTTNNQNALRAALHGCTLVVACFGAARIAKISDLWTRPERDSRHPSRVNFQGVATLAALSSKAGVRRFVRITGMSVGYSAWNPITVLLNAVLSMTIRYQLLGEMAIRSTAPLGLEYTVIRPGALTDKPRPKGAVVQLGYGNAHVPAGTISRDDIADLVVRSLWSPFTANTTLSAAGSPTPKGGVTTEMSWDPARGMHYRAVQIDKGVQEGTEWAPLLQNVKEDTDFLQPKNHQRPVGLFFTVVAGVIAAVLYFLSGVGKDHFIPWAKTKLEPFIADHVMPFINLEVAPRAEESWEVLSVLAQECAAFVVTWTQEHLGDLQPFIRENIVTAGSYINDVAIPWTKSIINLHVMPVVEGLIMRLVGA